MVKVPRFDAAPLQAKKSPEGFLYGEARLTRTGIFEYHQPDGGVRRELRLPEEVFKADSMSLLALAPMTNDHPPGGVTTENAKEVTIGAIGTPRRDGKFVVAPYKITDAAAIADVESGKRREISLGYNCRLDFTPGFYNGERYDAVQRDIEPNHAAIVERGRAGPEVRIDGVCLWRTDGVDQPQQENTMKKIRIDGVEYEVSEQVAQAFEKHEVKNADTLKELQGKADKAAARADQLEDEAKKLRADSADDKIKKAVTERVKLEKDASKVLGNDFKLDGKGIADLTATELHTAVIKKVSPSADLTGKNADYVLARFDTAIESFDATRNSNARDTITNADGTAAGTTDLEKEREAMIKKSREMKKITAA